jgi:hypothetical protein
VGEAYLYVACSPIEVEMEVLDVSPLAKQILQILLAGFLMDIGNHDDPAFYTADGNGAKGSTSFI